jgi:predicted ATPase/DNA-binding SARP family transcriptional activator
MGSANSGGGLRVGLLGPVEMWVGASPVALGGPRPRALLAVLALAEGRVMSSERLIDELWDDEPPARARDSLQVHVSRLRRALADAGAPADRLVNRSGGYVFELQPGESDLEPWNAALTRSRALRAAGQYEQARAALVEGLAGWRGVPLDGLQLTRTLAGERARLEEQHLAATVDVLELDVELGRHRELPERLEPLLVDHPFNERLVAVQMLALYRSGRQADALAAFHAARRRFVTELGIEPPASLRELHDNVLTQAPQVSARDVGFAPVPMRGDGAVPVPPNRTLGRKAEIDALSRRVRSGRARLLTLVGPGGVGKTRLAVETASSLESHFAHGVYFVSLAGVRRAPEVAAAFAAALGVPVLEGETAEQSLERFLAGKHVLLVADNFEHVLPAAPLVAALRDACPALTVLATSRAPLDLTGEERYPVAPLELPALGVPEPAANFADSPAVALFVDRARAQDPRFALHNENARAIAEICHHLDGLPLAIELAAARSTVLEPGDLAGRLEAALSVLGHGPRDAPARQRTLQATIDWSFNLLDETERDALTAQAVFVGGCSVSAAEEVSGASLDTLEALVAKSLLVRRGNRLTMLETVRQYVEERAAERPYLHDARARHARYFLAFAQQAQAGLLGEDRARWQAALDADGGNLMAAITWALSARDSLLSLRLATTIVNCWLRSQATPHPVEGRELEWIDAACELAGPDAPARLRAEALLARAFLLNLMVATSDAAEESARRSHEIFVALDDSARAASALIALASTALNANRPGECAAYAAQALAHARVADDDFLIAEALSFQAATMPLAQAHPLIEEALRRYDRVGAVHRTPVVLGRVSYVAMAAGEYDGARELLDRALDHALSLSEPLVIALIRGNQGLCLLFDGHAPAAAGAFLEELEIARSMAFPAVAAEAFGGLGAVALLRDDAARAARLCGAFLRHTPTMHVLDERLCGEFFDPGRERVGAAAWDRQCEAGRRMTLDEASEYALEDTFSSYRR